LCFSLISKNHEKVNFRIESAGNHLPFIFIHFKRQS
jgi:hypothetical protein